MPSSWDKWRYWFLDKNERRSINITLFLVWLFGCLPIGCGIGCSISGKPEPDIVFGTVGVIITSIIVLGPVFAFYTSIEPKFKKAEDGDPIAMYDVAKYYWYAPVARSECSHKECIAKGLGWYQRAAQQGHVEAAFFLGSCFERGIYVEMDINLALACYQIAADQGHKDAQSRIDVLKNQSENKIDFFNL